MPGTHTIVTVEPLALDLHDLSPAEQSQLREAATSAANAAAWLPAKSRSARPREILRAETREFHKVEAQLRRDISEDAPLDLRALHDNLRLIHAAIQDLEDASKSLAKLPLTRLNGDTIPRAIALARKLVSAAHNHVTVAKFVCFVEAAQKVEPLRIAELWGMLPALRLALLERLTAAAKEVLSNPVATPSRGIDKLLLSLRLISDLDWKKTIEQLSYVHRILLKDPAGVYPRMDYESREMYRQAVERVARRSDVSEIELAQRLVDTARQAKVTPDMPPALRDRLRHVGYYLVDEDGARDFWASVGYRPSFGRRVELLFHSYPDEVYQVITDVAKTIP